MYPKLIKCSKFGYNKLSFRTFNEDTQIVRINKY